MNLRTSTAALLFILAAVHASSGGCVNHARACAEAGDLVYDDKTGLCVECVDDEDCDGQGSCIDKSFCGCLTDSDCVNDGRGPVCGAFHQCGCNTSADCASGDYTACVSPSKVCGCAGNFECYGDVPYCDTPSGRCVECMSDADCTAPYATICDTTMHSCMYTGK